MRTRWLLFITMLALCHLQLGGQVLTNALPFSPQEPAAAEDAVLQGAASALPDDPVPDDPDQEILPIAVPEPAPASGVPVRWEAQTQTRVGDVWTLLGAVVVHYSDYVLHADKVVYHQSTTKLEAEGHLQAAGGPEDALINADHGEMQLNAHTARFYNVKGTMGVRRAGRTEVYSTPTPFRFSGRELIQMGEGQYRMVDGSMTNCRLPKPDWVLIAHSITLANGKASMENSVFKLFGVPLFYLPFLRHPMDETGRESGLLIPVVGNSSIKGFIFGEQVYWAISRDMDMLVGSEYYSKRGWAPNGDFRYKGPGLDHVTARWNALLDRGIEVAGSAAPYALTNVNQGGVDIAVLGRKDLTAQTHVAANVDFLSNYIYRLVFNDNYWQAVSSEVASNLSLTHEHNGFVPSGSMERFQSFAGAINGDQESINGNQARILHLPSLRFDVLDHPFGPFYAGLGSSAAFLNRSEPGFHARNVGRLDIYPHLSLPLVGGGWSVVPEAALRSTFYSISQNPDLTGTNGGLPTIRHELLDRADIEAAVDIRPPAIERDFFLGRWNRVLRHVIEPEFTYRYVNGVGLKARNVVLIDTTDIATDTNEVGFSLTQRFYMRPGSLDSGNPDTSSLKPCIPDAGAASGLCPAAAREWASWRIAQKFFFNRDFGGTLIPGRRNVFDTTLDLSPIAFLTSPRDLSPVTSRLRFEAIDNLRIEWDLDYDPKAGRLSADNIYAGYSWGRTTVGLGHALLNAVDEAGTTASSTQNQQLQPSITIGKPSGVGFDLAANGSYDFVHGTVQYAGVEAVYNWNCCGLTVGYRRFTLGSVRQETQYLYSFTLANFGSVPGINRSKSVFRDPALPPAY
jgi:LPS-assembly protein